MLELSNPRTTTFVEDWPHGFTGKTTATFSVETTKKGQRIVRQTASEGRRPSKPKKTTYHLRMCIVDGDGQLYLLGITQYDQIVLIPGTLKTTEYFHKGDSDPEKAVAHTTYKAILYGEYE